MSTKKRWLKQVIKEASDKHYDMPWEQDTRPVAFANILKNSKQPKAA